jgi:hypothetical protein
VTSHFTATDATGSRIMIAPPSHCLTHGCFEKAYSFSFFFLLPLDRRRTSTRSTAFLGQARQPSPSTPRRQNAFQFPRPPRKSHRHLSFPQPRKQASSIARLVSSRRAVLFLLPVVHLALLPLPRFSGLAPPYESDRHDLCPFGRVGPVACLLGAGRGDARLYSWRARGRRCGDAGVLVSGVSISWTEEFEDLAEGACGGGAFDLGGQCRVRGWVGLGWGGGYGEFLSGGRKEGREGRNIEEVY